MRMLVLAMTVGVVLLLDASAAWATCDGCGCGFEATLAGWSKDGRTHAEIRHWGPSASELVVISSTGTRSWSAFHDDAHDAFCVQSHPSLPNKAGRDARRIDVATWPPLARDQLVPVDDVWRRAFDAELTVTATGVRTFRKDPWKLGLSSMGDICPSWTIRDRAGHVVTTLPRDCTGGGSTFVRLRVAGGYLHPDGKFALIKLIVEQTGYASDHRFIRVSLRSVAP